MKDNCPFEAWQLIQAKEILMWMRFESDLGINSVNIITSIEDALFDIAYEKLGLKPIGKCSIQELQEELNKRLGR